MDNLSLKHIYHVHLKLSFYDSWDIECIIYTQNAESNTVKIEESFCKAILIIDVTATRLSFLISF